MSGGMRVAARHPMASAADACWRAACEEERDRVLLLRLRWCAALVIACNAGSSLLSAVLRHPDWALELQSWMWTSLISAPVAALTTLSVMRRWAAPLGVAYLLTLTATLTQSASVLPALASLVPATMVALMLGTTLLLPWGTAYQALVCTGAVVGFMIVAGHGAIRPLLPATCLVTSAGLVAALGAALVDRYRVTAFERAWVQEQLVESARALARHTETVEVAGALVANAERLVRADTIVLALHDAPGGVVRVVADTSGTPELVGLEVPDTLEPVRALLDQGLVCLPLDDPKNPINAVLAARGVCHVLYTTLRHAGAPLGILAFVRHQPEPFSASTRLIVQGLTEQAAQALATARLVNDLRTANRLKTEFVSTMSHELRTPLNVIIGFAEMLSDDHLEGRARTQAVDRIALAGRDLLELIDNTLAVGRLDAGRDDLRLQTLSLPGFWRTLGERCARMPRRAEVVLDWGVAPELQARTDPRKVEVVVANLVGNALKFTERGRVAVTVGLDGDALVLRISDTGIGIPLVDQPHVFDMFRQLDASDSRRFGGAGLGLYIVRRFTERLGGTVALESTPGVGSTFTVRLPATVARDPLRSAA